MAKICCIIPVYNAARYVSSTIQSVLEQSVVPDEIIAINDGSTDDSLDVLQQYKDKIKIITAPHQGVGASLNIGLQNTKSEFITFIDSDDLWQPDKTALQQAYLQANLEIDAVFCLVEQFTSEDCLQTLQFAQNRNILAGLSKLCIMLRRSALTETGNFDETLQRGDFIEWFSRFKHAGLNYHIINEVLARRRLRGNSISSNPDTEKEFARVLKIHLDRKRGR
jgi:glycosyltransferase involved in cell wall biosynthesis